MVTLKYLVTVDADAGRAKAVAIELVGGTPPAPGSADVASITTDQRKILNAINDAFVRQVLSDFKKEGEDSKCQQQQQNQCLA